MDDQNDDRDAQQLASVVVTLTKRIVTLTLVLGALTLLLAAGTGYLIKIAMHTDDQLTQLNEYAKEHGNLEIRYIPAAPK